MDTPLISLKQMRIIAAIARHRGFAVAADHLNMTQSVISRSIKAAEKSLGITLFQRGWGGAEPTTLGEIVVKQALYTLAKIRDIEAQITQQTGQKIRLLSFLKWHHLTAIAAVTRFGGASNAAQNLDLKQPAISRAIIALSQYMNLPLFERKREGLEATPLAWQLTALYNELQKEFASLPDKLNRTNTGLSGRIAVGMLPFSGQDLVAKAFGKLTKQHPSLRLIAVSGNYTMLIQALRQGDIDCIMGMLRQPPPHDDLQEAYIYSEQYALIARKDHPCHQHKSAKTSLQNQQWIGAPHGTPVREYLELFFKNLGLTPPTQTCEIHSFTNAEQMIIDSDSIALLSYSQQKLANLRPELKCIELDMPNAKNAIGLTFLASDIRSEPLTAFKQIIMQLADDIG
ncbi:MAG: LysR family transcriptional regulator [OCS116 cluster bacterium]|nr:LysR family transcriptional regulator [OCS116 cluster bacterium]